MGSHDDRKTFEGDATVPDHDDTHRIVPLGLTIAWHPDVSRVGEIARLGPGRTVLSRYDVEFHDVDGGAARCLDTHMVTRRPIFIDIAESTVSISPPADRPGPYVDGVRLQTRRTWSREQIEERMLLIDVSHRLLLALHPMPEVPPAMSRHEMVGDSAAIRRLRLAVDKAACFDRPVLIRGETGSGKELVAAGIHNASWRRARTFVPINCGELRAERISATLFGHVKGAFTGAISDQPGAFRAAQGGTLFLDEIGELHPEAQPTLLRALDQKTVTPLGTNRPVSVDVRVVAATDADLEAKIADNSFRGPLYYRLHNIVIDVPPLRARPDDVPRLFLHRLRDGLESMDALDRLELGREKGKPWIDARLVQQMMRYPWPGNVRQLLSMADQVVHASHDRPQVEQSAQLGWLRHSSDASMPTRPSTQRTGETSHFKLSTRSVERSTEARSTGLRSTGVSRAPSRSLSEASETHQRSRAETGDLPALGPEDVHPEPALLCGSDGQTYTPAGVQRLLRLNGWGIHRTARKIGVPKTSLARYAERELGIMPVSKIPETDLRSVWEAEGGRIGALKDRLRVTERALRQRLRRLGLSFEP